MWERAGERCYCCHSKWGLYRGVEGAGGEKGGHSHTDQKTTVPSCAWRTDAAVYLHWELGEGGGIDFYLLKKLQLSPRLPSSLLFPSTQLVWSRRGLSACTDEAQDQSSGRATVPAALLPALLSCVSLLYTCTAKFSCGHTFRELSLARTHLHADKQAARQAHPLPLSVREAVLLILVWAARGCIWLLSSSSSSSSSRTGPEESSHQ